MSAENEFLGPPCQSELRQWLSRSHFDHVYLIMHTPCLFHQLFLYLNLKLGSISWRWAWGDCTPLSAALLRVTTSIKPSFLFYEPLLVFLAAACDTWGTAEVQALDPTTAVADISRMVLLTHQQILVPWSVCFRLPEDQFLSLYLHKSFCTLH